MKKIIFISFLALMVIASRPVSAQAGNDLCYTSSELLDMVGSIKTATAIGDLNFLAVMPWIYTAESQSGFYVKDKKAGDKWCLVASHHKEAGDYDPEGTIMFYEEAVRYDDAPSTKNLTRAHKGKYPAGRLVVLFYKNEAGHQLFDVYDLKLRKVISN
jgi:uncharacterized protein (DUF2237 family)